MYPAVFVFLPSLCFLTDFALESAFEFPDVMEDDSIADNEDDHGHEEIRNGSEIRQNGALRRVFRVNVAMRQRVVGRVVGCGS